MDICLTDRELEILRQVLQSHLASLREETRRTEKHDWRAQLQEEKSAVQMLLAKLGAL